MIKRDSSDIDLLLSVLLVSSTIIGGLHHLSLRARQDVDSQKTTIRDISSVEIIEQIEPFILSQSVEKLIRQIYGIPFKTIMPVLVYLLSDKVETLNRDDLVQIIVGAAAAYKDEKERNQILDLILDPKYPSLIKGKPVLYIAAYGEYPQVIPAIKAWYAKRVAQQSNHATLTQELETRALAHAAETNDLDSLKALVSHGVVLTKDRAGAFLNEAIRRRTGCPIIGYLLDQGADINYVVAGYTPLLRAIANNDIAAVKKLVERGADINKIGSNAVGNPRQVAHDALVKAADLKKKNGDQKSAQAAQDAVDIESYLIERGAKN